MIPPRVELIVVLNEPFHRVFVEFDRIISKKHVSAVVHNVSYLEISQVYDHGSIHYQTAVPELS